MVSAVLFFGVVGLVSVLLGWWGLRHTAELGRVEGWDEDARDQRRGVLRRGCVTCMAVGAVFLAIALASPFVATGH